MHEWDSKAQKVSENSSINMYPHNRARAALMSRAGTRKVTCVVISGNIDLDELIQIFQVMHSNCARACAEEKEADPDLIFKLYPPNAIIPIWEQFEPLVKYTRESHGFPDHWEPFEYLYTEAKKRYPEISWKRMEQKRLL